MALSPLRQLTLCRTTSCHQRWLSRLYRPLVTLAAVVLCWQLLVSLAGISKFILPSPIAVLQAIYEHQALLLHNSGITLLEIVLGMLLGSTLGIVSALILITWEPVRRWLMPILVISQSIPVFALAPILVLWLGFGLPSKVAMAMLVIYFPVTTACFDGLRQTPAGYIHLARSMGASRRAILWQIRIPSALPALASGLRVAAAFAPVGAIIGEWIGSSSGLGRLMINANARSQIDLMFAALIVLAIMAVLFHWLVNYAVTRATPWVRETASTVSR